MSILKVNQDGSTWESASEEDFLQDQEPSEGDILTEDYIDWYMDGKRILTTLKPGPYSESSDDWRESLMEWMDLAEWWPNVWFISDHGNCHVVDMGRPSPEEVS